MPQIAELKKFTFS